MTQPQAEPFGIPPETLGWRLRRALEWASVSAKEMASELDVSEGTISRWCHDVGSPPRSIYLRAWAAKCRVPYDWLLHGDNQWAAGDSNPKPEDLSPEPVQVGTSELDAALKTQFLKAIRPDRQPRAGRPRQVRT